MAYYSYGPVTPTGPITVSVDFDVAGAGALTIVAISSVSPFDSGDDFKDWAAGVQDEGGTALYSVSSDFPLIDASIARSTWYNLSMTLDYATQTFDVTLDGNLLASGSPFCSVATSGVSCTGAESAQFEGIELAQNSGLKYGAVYFGDVSITEVPEPGAWTMMIAGVALTGAALRTRRRLAA